MQVSPLSVSPSWWRCTHEKGAESTQRTQRVINIVVISFQFFKETAAFLHCHLLLTSQSTNPGQPFCALTCAAGTCCFPRGQQGASYGALLYLLMFVAIHKRNSWNHSTACFLCPFAAESMWWGMGELVSVLSKSLCVSVFLTLSCKPDMSAMLEKEALSLDKSPLWSNQLGHIVA